MPKSHLNEFNNSNTLAIISPYLEKGENFCGYSIGRYTKLLAESFPKNQKIVVFCDSQISDRPHKVLKNILLVPSYKINSPVFLFGLVSRFLEFNRIKNFLIQFEFSIFGGKVVVMQIPALLLILKILGKRINITIHQVVTDLGTLSGHLAIKKQSLKTKILNYFLKTFYTFTGVVANKVIVHDEILAERIGKFVNRNKVGIVPHGTFTLTRFNSKAESDSKKHFGVKDGYRVVGAFGFCSWYKGTDWVIENFAKFTRENPKLRVKLLVAGGESPTLKGTNAYKIYHEKLMKVIKEANGNIVYSGFVPEKDVEKVFAASDLMVFPYRTRMSASGALSLCLGYGRPFIASKAFSESAPEFVGNTFNLTYGSFERVLKHNLIDKKEMIANLSDRTWLNVAKEYMDVMLQGIEIDPKLEYAEVI